jgi:hypothetical protein
MGLGDLVESALVAVGVTKERVESLLGQNCGCEQRKQRLNQLSAWAYRVIVGGGSLAPGEDSKPVILPVTEEKAEEHRKYLDAITGDWQEAKK